MSYYAYVKNDKALNSMYEAIPTGLNTYASAFNTIEEAESYARDYIDKWYKDLHDLSKHKKVQTDFDLFRIWIVDSEAIARDYMQQYVQKNWKPGQDFAIEHIVKKVKDIYPSNYFSKKAIVKKVKVQFDTKQETKDAIAQIKDRANARSKELSDAYKSDPWNNIRCVRDKNTTEDLSMIKDEYAFIFPAKGYSHVKTNEHSAKIAPGRGYILAHITYNPNFKWKHSSGEDPDPQYDVDFYERFKDLNSLKIFSSVRGWTPIECPKVFFYRNADNDCGTIIYKGNIKKALAIINSLAA